MPQSMQSTGPTPVRFACPPKDGKYISELENDRVAQTILLADDSKVSLEGQLQSRTGVLSPEEREEFNVWSDRPLPPSKAVVERLRFMPDRNTERMIRKMGMILPFYLKEFFDNFATAYSLNDISRAFFPFVERPGLPFEFLKWPFGHFEEENISEWDWSWRQLAGRVEAHLDKKAASTREFLTCLMDNNYGIHPAVAEHAAWLMQAHPAVSAGGAGSSVHDVSKWLSVSKAADRLGLTPGAISHACSKGRLQHLGSGHERRIDPVSLEAYRKRKRHIRSDSESITEDLYYVADKGY